MQIPTSQPRPPASPMRSGLFKFGAAATTVWLLVGLSVMCWASAPAALKPNEWGDAFAGLFAPVAFLWLVLGFLQQGTELQLSTRALELQVTELKNSVEQQQALVEASRRQVQATLDEQERRLKTEHARTQPRLVVRPAERVSASGRTKWQFDVANDGEMATDLTLTFTPPSATNDRNFFQSLRRGESVPGFFTPIHDFPAEGLKLNLTYSDINQVQHREIYEIKLPLGARADELRVTKIAKSE